MSENASGLRLPRSLWIAFSLIGIVVIIVISVIFVDRISTLYVLFFGYNRFKDLFYGGLGLSDSTSSFLATALQFVYAFAWVPLTGLMLAWRMSARKLFMGFLAWMMVYGSSPLLLSLFGQNVCFNQATGTPSKWYTIDRSGRIALYDSGGLNSLGDPKKPVTSEVCHFFAQQSGGTQAHLLTSSVGGIDFFDTSTGNPKVWYHKDEDGTYRLYDGPGFDPQTGQALQPVSKDTVDDIKKWDAQKQSDSAPPAGSVASTDSESPSNDPSTQSDSSTVQDSTQMQTDNLAVTAAPLQQLQAGGQTYLWQWNGTSFSDAEQVPQGTQLQIVNAWPTDPNYVEVRLLDSNGSEVKRGVTLRSSVVVAQQTASPSLSSSPTPQTYNASINSRNRSQISRQPISGLQKGHNSVQQLFGPPRFLTAPTVRLVPNVRTAGRAMTVKSTSHH
jgi:hypothetical protein